MSTSPTISSAAPSVATATLIGEFLQHLKDARRRSASTISSYLADLAQLDRFLQRRIGSSTRAAVAGGSDERFTSCQSEDVAEFIAYLTKQNYSASSIARKIAALRAFFVFLLDRKIITSNPAQRVQGPLRDRQEEKIVVEDLQLQRLLQLPDCTTFVGTRDAAILHLICGSGIRISEIGAARIGDIDTNLSTIRLNTSASRARHLKITPQGMVAIRTYLVRRSILLHSTLASGDRVFVTSSGESIGGRSLRRILKKHLVRAGLGAVNAHHIRRAFARRLLAQNVNPQKIRQLLGRRSHVSISPLPLNPPTANHNPAEIFKRVAA